MSPVQHRRRKSAARMIGTRHAQTGFTLIEVLVTFVILAIGVLGIVTLMLTAKTSEYEAVQRTRAVTIADGMVERIRNNPSEVGAYVTDNPLDGAQIGTEPSPNCNSGSCSAAQRAAHDLWAWERELRGAAVTVVEGGETQEVAGLNTPRGCVLFAPQPGSTTAGVVSILVQWRGLQSSVDGVDEGQIACGGGNAGTDPYRRSVVATTFVVDEAQ